jgi:hypothetical protein
MNHWKMKLSASVASEDVGFRVQDSGFRVYIRPMAERGRSNAQARLPVSFRRLGFAECRVGYGALQVCFPAANQKRPGTVFVPPFLRCQEFGVPGRLRPTLAGRSQGSGTAQTGQSTCVHW